MTDLLPLSLTAGPEPSADLLVLGCLEGDSPPLEGLSEELIAAAEAIASRPGFTGRGGQIAEGPGAGEVSVIRLHGLGKEAKVEPRTVDCWLEREVRSARSGGFRRPAFRLPAHPLTTGGEAARRICRQLLVAGYRFDRFKGSSSDEPSWPEGLQLMAPPAVDDSGPAAYEAALPAARAIAAGVAFTRDLANTPGNVADPEWIAEQARKMAEKNGYRCTVLDERELADRGMGGLLAVGGGSASPPRLVRLERRGGGPKVALVGKGVTFDTGGISLKPSPAMDEMKYDKSGACAVLGAALAAAQLELPVDLTVYVPLAENMPDGAAYRPGDIVTTYSGKTVEILNTDAEGRMILADALWLASEEGAELLVELSTLTGACVVALGRGAAGLFSPHDTLAGELLAAAERSGERLWRMPTWSEYAEQMKGNHADLKNTGERWGGAATAAAFLGNFVGRVGEWAHLDIAGPANRVSKDPSMPNGATGYGVPLLIEWLRHRIEQSGG